jgi:hypothetical protein
VGIEVVEAGAPVGLGDAAGAEAAVECGWGGEETARAGGVGINGELGDGVRAGEVGFECVEVVGDVFAGVCVVVVLVLVFVLILGF